MDPSIAVRMRSGHYDRMYGKFLNIGLMLLAFVSAPVMAQLDDLNEPPPEVLPCDVLEGEAGAQAQVCNTDTGHAYQRFADPTSWGAAAAACEAKGAHLVTISDAAEQGFLNSLFASCGGYGCWIGGLDPENDGSFEWITGEPMSFSNWAAGEPNEHCDGEDFMHAFPGGDWNDQQAGGQCSDWGPMGYVCEWDLGGARAH